MAAGDGDDAGVGVDAAGDVSALPSTTAGAPPGDAGPDMGACTACVGGFTPGTAVRGRVGAPAQPRAVGSLRGRADALHVQAPAHAAPTPRQRSPPVQGWRHASSCSWSSASAGRARCETLQARRVLCGPLAVADQPGPCPTPRTPPHASTGVSQVACTRSGHRRGSDSPLISALPPGRQWRDERHQICRALSRHALAAVTRRRHTAHPDHRRATARSSPQPRPPSARSTMAAALIAPASLEAACRILEDASKSAAEVEDAFNVITDGATQRGVDGRPALSRPTMIAAATVDAFTRHASSARTAAAGCIALLALSVDSPDALISAGAITAVTAALTRHTDEALIAGAASAVLTQLAAGAGLGTLPILVPLLTKYADDELVASCVCDALHGVVAAVWRSSRPAACLRSSLRLPQAHPRFGRQRGGRSSRSSKREAHRQSLRRSSAGPSRLLRQRQQRTRHAQLSGVCALQPT